jgi:hypothetical protein
LYELELITCSYIVIDTRKRGVVLKFSHHIEREEVATTFTFVNVSYRSCSKFTAFAAVFEFHLLILLERRGRLLSPSPLAE